MKKLSFIFVCLIPVLTGCTDTNYDILYKVENLTGQTLSIEAVCKKYASSAAQEQSFTVAPGETVQVASHSGINGPKYVPDDDWHYYPDQLLPPAFEIFDVSIRVGNELLPDDIRQSKNWDYEAKKLLGVYTLRITKEMAE